MNIIELNPSGDTKDRLPRIVLLREKLIKYLLDLMIEEELELVGDPREIEDITQGISYELRADKLNKWIERFLGIDQSSSSSVISLDLLSSFYESSISKKDITKLRTIYYKSIHSSISGEEFLELKRLLVLFCKSGLSTEHIYEILTGLDDGN